MSAPSEAHEDRVRVLETLAILAGFPSELWIGQRLMPDVARYDPISWSLFVGDAKATETSGCAATRARLGAYVRAIRPWRRDGATLTLVIAMGDRSRRYVGAMPSLPFPTGWRGTAVSNWIAGSRCRMWIGTSYCSHEGERSGLSPTDTSPLTRV